MRTPISRVRAAALLGACGLAVWLAGGGTAPGHSVRLSEGRHPEENGAVLLKGREPSPLSTCFAGRFCPLEERLFADAADGRLDEFGLLEAALIAGGVEDAEVLEGYRRRQAGLLEELGRSGGLSGPPRQRAQAVFEFMHRRVLRAGYRTDCTDLRAALDEGRFNCVSASVLFNCLAREAGLAVCGLEAPGHTMSRLRLPDGPLDVETTCPRWFQLLDSPQKQAELVEKTPGAAPSADRSQAREVSDAQMAAMVYYNRGVDLLAEQRFGQAAAANAKALRLDPQSATARGNLLATINNWAIALGSSDRYAEAVGLLREGLRLDPAYETFSLNYVHVHYQWVEHLCRSGRFEEALELLAQAAAELPDREYFRRAPLEVYRRWTRAVLADGEADRTGATFAQTGGRPGASRGPLATGVEEISGRRPAWWEGGPFRGLLGGGRSPAEARQ